MRSRPVIFVDLDGMAADLLSRLLHYYNEEHAADVGPLDTDVWPNLDLDKYLERDGVFKDLLPIAGFASALPRLRELGDVLVASSPSRNHDSATDKIHWVTERFPIHRRDIILIHHKHHLRGDVFLEDYGKNIRKIRASNPRAFIGGIAYPYNAAEARLMDVRAEGIGDTAAAWGEIVVGVGRYVQGTK